MSFYDTAIMFVVFFMVMLFVPDMVQALVREAKREIAWRQISKKNS